MGQTSTFSPWVSQQEYSAAQNIITVVHTTKEAAHHHPCYQDNKPWARAVLYQHIDKWAAEGAQYPRKGCWVLVPMDPIWQWQRLSRWLKGRLQGAPRQSAQAELVGFQVLRFRWRDANPHRLMCWYAWSQVGGAVLGGSEPSGVWSSRRK